MRHQPRSWQSHLKECRRRLVGRKKFHLAQPLVVRDSHVMGASLPECEPRTVKPPRYQQEYVSTAERLGASMLISNTTFHTNTFGLLGKSERNINADCRGHDFDRPRQLPHIKLTLHHATGLCFSCGIFRVWDNCEEGLGTFVVQ